MSKETVGIVLASHSKSLVEAAYTATALLQTDAEIDEIMAQLDDVKINK